MKLSKKINVWSLLVVGVFLVNGGVATSSEMLPSSSTYEGHQYFSRYAGESWINGRIDFAVYDTETNPDEFIGGGGYDRPGTGRYVYAYQLFNDLLSSDESIAYFSVLNLDGSLLQGVSGTGAQDDGSGGIGPVDSDTQGLWRWELSNGGYIDRLEHSWFLAFSSDMNWVPGTYDIRAPGESDIPSPGDAPEPATVMLFGLGSLMLARRQRKS